MWMPAIAGPVADSRPRAQALKRSSDDVITVGRNRVTPVARSAAAARATSSAVRPGELKSTPAKPLTWMSTKAGNWRRIAGRRR